MGLIAAGILLAASAAASPEDPYGEDWIAMAVSPSTGNAGYGGGGNADEAVRIALNECRDHTNGGRCEVASVIEYGCVAYAWNVHTQSWTGGRGPDKDSATADAAGKLMPYMQGDVRGNAICSNPVVPPN
jgi:hypothetical protein